MLSFVSCLGMARVLCALQTTSLLRACRQVESLPQWRPVMCRPGAPIERASPATRRVAGRCDAAVAPVAGNPGPAWRRVWLWQARGYGAASSAALPIVTPWPLAASAACGVNRAATGTRRGVLRPDGNRQLRDRGPAPEDNQPRGDGGVLLRAVA